MDQRASLLLGIAALLASVLLAACGRKGPLELPPNAPPQAQTQAESAAQARILPVQDNPGLIQPPNRYVDQPAAEKLDQAAQSPSRPINAAPAPAKKPFLLDPLL